MPRCDPKLPTRCCPPAYDWRPSHELLYLPCIRARLNRLRKKSTDACFRVELAFRPASKPFFSLSESASADSTCITFFCNLFSRAPIRSCPFYKMSFRLQEHDAATHWGGELQKYGGEGEIRTPDTRQGMAAFEAARFNHSRTSPRAVASGRSCQAHTV